VRSLSATQQRRDEGASQPSPRLRSTSAARPVGEVLGISALVNFGGTAVFWGLALGQRGVVEAHCPDKQCDREGFDAGQRARGFVNLGTLTLGVGVAGAAGAAILLWPRKATTSVALGILPGGVGLAVESSL